MVPHELAAGIAPGVSAGLILYGPEDDETPMAVADVVEDAKGRVKAAYGIAL